MKGYGIDFGTTNSVVVACTPTENNPFTILGDQEGRPHPSVVWYKQGSAPVVGRIAKQQIHIHEVDMGNFFVRSIKRRLGKSERFDVFSEQKTAWEIASDIFSYLVRHARSHDEDVQEAVVTIPVRFDGRARRDLRRAANKAGIHISTFVHEPFAAVVGHVFRQEGVTGFARLAGKTILVFDWGGGTLDVTLARVESDGLVELASSGLNDRSGDFFDDLILRWSKQLFETQEGLTEADVTIPATRMDGYLINCENAKLTLSSLQFTQLQAAQVFQTPNGMFNLDTTLNRSQFEAEIEPTVDEAVNLVSEVLKTANLMDRQVDEVLLIGGTSRIPFIHEKLHERFGPRITHVDDADMIIAEGAAVVASLNMRPFLARTIAIALADGQYFPVFSAGLPAIPSACREKLSMFCTDNRDGWARLIVAEGIHSDEHVQYHTKGNLPIRVSASLAKPYRPERVDVDFTLNDDLVLEITGRGATRPEQEDARTTISDLCFGLSLKVV